jgi:hypothetical protein
MRNLAVIFSLTLITLASNSFAQSCNPSSPSCGTGKGCYNRELEDMFDGDEQQQDQLMTDVGNHLGENEPKATGSACNDDKDCESISCKVINDNGDKQCVAEFVCRKARVGEVLTAGATCDNNLIVVNNTCTEDGNTIYAGLPQGGLAPSETNVCEYEFPEDKHRAATRAMYNMRALEVFFSRASTANDQHECLKIAETLKPIGEDLANRRKMLVRNFNQDWNEIEANITAIMSAQDNSNNIVTLFGTKISSQEVARRKALGIDMLEIMRRRAVVQKQYETGMLLLYNHVAAKLQSIETEISNFGQNSKEWTIGGRHYRAKDLRDCRWGVWGLFNRKIKNRWDRYYVVPGNRTEGILNSIKGQTHTYRYLSEIYGSESKVDNKFHHDGYYFLVDPMFPDMNNQMPFRSYGTYMLFHGPEKRRKLESVDNFMDRFRTVAKDHTNAIKDSGMVGADKFMFDPDLVKLSAKNCVDQPSNPNCNDFESFKDRLAQTVFALFLSSARHHHHKFVSYFATGDSGIRNTFSDLRASSATAEEFYFAMKAYRDKQIACLEAQIGGVENDFMSLGGLNEGGTNNYAAGSPASSSKPKTTTKSAPLTLAQNKKWDLGISSKMLNAINTDNLLKNYNQDKSNGNVSLSYEAREAMAARLKSMEEANKKSVAAGKNLKQAEEQIQKSLKSSNLPSSIASISSGLNSVTPSGLSKVSSSSVTESSKPETTPVASSSAKSSAPTANKATVSEAGLVGGSAAADTTGMSEEEKSHIMANYDRTKGEYKAKEEDGLFKILSKAYVRSLDKVLKRKKPGED